MSFVQYLTGLEATKIVVDTTGKVRSVLGDTAEIANNIQDNFFGVVNNAELGLYNVALTVQENVANIAYDAEIRGLNIAADLVERGTMLVYDIIEIVSYLVLLGAVLTIVVILLFHSEIFKLSGLLVTTLGGLSGKYLGLSGAADQNTDPQKIEDARKKASKAVEAFMPVKIENLRQRDIAEKQMKYAVDSAITSSFGNQSGSLLGNLKTAIVGTDTSPKIIETTSSEPLKEAIREEVKEEAKKEVEEELKKEAPIRSALEEYPDNVQAVPYNPMVPRLQQEEFNLVPEGYNTEEYRKPMDDRSTRPLFEEIYEPPKQEIAINNRPNTPEILSKLDTDVIIDPVDPNKPIEDVTEEKKIVEEEEEPEVIIENATYDPKEPVNVTETILSKKIPLVTGHESRMTAADYEKKHDAVLSNIKIIMSKINGGDYSDGILRSLNDNNIALIRISKDHGYNSSLDMKNSLLDVAAAESDFEDYLTNLGRYGEAAYFRAGKNALRIRANEIAKTAEKKGPPQGSLRRPLTRWSNIK